jgi:hypothetical protein
VLEGVPPLTDAVMKAVKQWRYSPVLLNGKPVPVIMTVTTQYKDSGPYLGGLLDSLKSKNEFIRESAATLLGRRPSDRKLQGKDLEEVTRELQRLREHDESERVRTAAAQALVQLGGQ